jgi:hypothetical protein
MLRAIFITIAGKSIVSLCFKHKAMGMRQSNMYHKTVHADFRGG